ncbi:hypothetical protein MTO96_020044 [Rhipicephalus appendiculatus]
MGHRFSRRTSGVAPALRPAAQGHRSSVVAPSEASFISCSGIARTPDDAYSICSDWLPGAMTSESKMSVLRGMLQLGINLLRELRHAFPSEANVVLSPYGVASALEELLVGSRGDTARQISAALHIPMEDKVSTYFDYCDREIPNRRRTDAARRFDMGYLNNMHHAQTLVAMDPLSQEGKHLRLERFSWDFANAAEESRVEIDHYACLYANPFEPNEILPPGCITPASLVCMVSVVDFRGSWKQAFDDRTATRELFHESDGRSTSVIMVHQTGRFRFCKVSRPARHGSGAAVRKAGTGTNVGGFCITVRRLHACIRICDTSHVTELTPALSALGVRDVFTQHALLWGSTMGDKRVTLMRHAAAFETSQNGGRRSSRTKQRQSQLARLARSIGVLLRMPRFRTDVISVDRPFAFFVTCSRPDTVMLLGSVREISW